MVLVCDTTTTNDDTTAPANPPRRANIQTLLHHAASPQHGRRRHPRPLPRATAAESQTLRRRTFGTCLSLHMAAAPTAHCTPTALPPAALAPKRRVACAYHPQTLLLAQSVPWNHIFLTCAKALTARKPRTQNPKTLASCLNPKLRASPAPCAHAIPSIAVIDPKP